MNVVVNGLMTNYQKAGKGKVLVFLHGWGDDSGTFDKLIERLKGSFEIFALDLPGFGGTQAPPKAWGLANYAHFVADWQRKIGQEKIEAMIGHSFGGSVAIAGVSEGVLVPKKLVLLASAGVREKKPLTHKILWAGAKVGKIPLYLLPANKARRVKKYLYRKAGSDLMFLPHMRETFIRTVREDLRPRAKLISQPSLLIYGQKDRETPVRHGQILAKTIPNSRLETIDTGHFLHQEKPEKVAHSIKEFLENG